MSTTSAKYGFRLFWLLILDPWSLAKHHRSTGFTSGHRSSGGNSAFSSRQLVAKTWPDTEEHRGTPRDTEGHRDQKSHCDRLFWHDVLLVVYMGPHMMLYACACIIMYTYVFIECMTSRAESLISQFFGNSWSSWLQLDCLCDARVFRRSGPTFKPPLRKENCRKDSRCMVWL